MQLTQARGRALIEGVGIPASVHGATLTAREREIIALLTFGYGSKEIALAIGCAVETVKSHVRHALAKTGARNRTHLVVLALRTPAPEEALNALPLAA